MVAAAASIPPRIEEDRYLALLQAANAIATCSDCNSASETLVKQLHEVTPFDYLHVVAFDKETSAPCWSVLEANGKTLDSPFDGVISLEDSPIRRARESGQPQVIADWNRETRFQEYRAFLAKLGIASTCSLPLTRGSRHLGVLSLGRFYPNAYDDEEIRFLRLVAQQIGLAIDAAVNFYVSQRVQDQLKLILDLTNQVVSNLEFNDLLHAASGSVRRVMACDAAAVMLVDGDGTHLRVHALDYPESRGIFTEGSLVPIEGTMPGDSFKSGKPMVINRLDPIDHAAGNVPQGGWRRPELLLRYTPDQQKSLTRSPGSCQARRERLRQG